MVTTVKNNTFTIEQFLSSQLLSSFSPKIQDLFKTLIYKLKALDLDFIIIKRNEPAIVFKVATMFYDKPTSKCNIATIWVSGKNCLQIEPYEGNDRTCYTYTSSAILDDDIINKIESIYKRKIKKFYSK